MASDPDFRMHLDYFADLADRRPGEVVVLPFRITDVYMDLIRGVTWSVWPSLYEPFGGVTETYVLLTPVIARATGGLVQQVVDFGIAPEDATGILYRESVPAARVWQETQQQAMQAALDPAVREATPLFRAQAEALKDAIMVAAELYRDHPADYGRLLANLPGMCRVLDWGRSVGEYRAWYDSASL
jgi:glycosyltransferase involved in cell wall biosynthesis